MRDLCFKNWLGCDEEARALMTLTAHAWLSGWSEKATAVALLYLTVVLVLFAQSSFSSTLQPKPTTRPSKPA